MCILLCILPEDVILQRIQVIILSFLSFFIHSVGYILATSNSPKNAKEKLYRLTIQSTICTQVIVVDVFACFFILRTLLVARSLVGCCCYFDGCGGVGWPGFRREWKCHLMNMKDCPQTVVTWKWSMSRSQVLWMSSFRWIAKHHLGWFAEAMTWLLQLFPQNLKASELWHCFQQIKDDICVICNLSGGDPIRWGWWPELQPIPGKFITTRRTHNSPKTCVARLWKSSFLNPNSLNPTKYAQLILISHKTASFQSDGTNSNIIELRLTAIIISRQVIISSRR